MKQELLPKKLERNLIFIQSRDGLMDMFFGGMLLAAGISGIFTFNGWEEPWYVRYLIIILLVPFILAKFLITTPRIGRIKMIPVKGGRKRFLITFMSITMFFTLLLLAAAIFNIPLLHDQPVRINPIIEFIGLLLVMGFVGWLIGLYTLFVYALFAGLGWPIAEMTGLKTIFNQPAEIFTFLIPGLLMIGFGVLRLIQFLKKYPIKNMNADYEPES